MPFPGTRPAVRDAVADLCNLSAHTVLRDASQGDLVNARRAVSRRCRRDTAGHKVRYLTVTDDLIRVLAYVSACRVAPSEQVSIRSVHWAGPEGSAVLDRLFKCKC